jgi:TfoX/Sxy family transcriptional regulator of competence genes
MTYKDMLAQRVYAALAHTPGLTEKKMFGGVGYLVNGNMACGVNKEDLIIRVGADAYEDALTEDHTRPFDFTGRPMKGWVVVEAAGYRTDDALQAWLARGLSFVQSLPPK